MRGWEPREFDPFVAKVTLDYILWYQCESHLDVGSNTAPYVMFSKSIGLKTVRCDIQGFTPDNVLGALPRLPFKDKTFDMVSCIQVLEHIGDTHNCIDDLCRVAKKLVIIQVPNGLKSVSYADPTHINHFTLSQLRKYQMEGWTQHIFASNVIATRLPYDVSMTHNILSKIFTQFYANNFFIVYVVNGLKPKVKQPGLLTNI